MVEKRDCSFCGEPIEPGTGLLFIQRDGTRLNFCKAKCRRNMLHLKRVPRYVRWTKHHVRGAAAAAPAPAPAPPAEPAPGGAEEPAPGPGEAPAEPVEREEPPPAAKPAK